MRERLLDLFWPVDLSLAEAAAELLDRDIDVDDLVGAMEKRV
jgi:hypothetical protein